MGRGHRHEPACPTASDARSATGGKRRSERKHTHVPEGCRESLDVRRVTGCDERLLALQSECADECVDRMRRGELDAGKKVPRALRDRPRKLRHPDSATVQDPINGRVSTRVAADFRENRHRNADQRAALVRDGQDGAGAIPEHPATVRKGERMDGLRVEDQRHGHSRRTFRKCSRDTGPNARSSSPRSSPSCSRSSSCAMARATNPESPRLPTRRRTADARALGTLTDSLAAGSLMTRTYPNANRATMSGKASRAGSRRFRGRLGITHRATSCAHRHRREPRARQRRLR